MFGLCMPTGELYLQLKDGKLENIAIVDLINPRKDIFAEDYILRAIKHYGYKNVEAIIYKRDSYKLKISMAEYWFENAGKLEEVK